MADKRDYYDVLGVPKGVDDQTLKKAYRKLAMKHHPDRNPDDAEAEELFKEAAEAYSVLSDTDKRAQYDRFGHEGLRGGGGAGMNPEDVFSSFSSVFSDFFGGGGRRANPNAPQKGNDLQMPLDVPFSMAVHGGELEVNVPRRATCDTCEGSGAAEGSKPSKCSTCGGHGQVRLQQGMFTIQTPCRRCGGSGQIITNPCVTCNGGGLVREDRELSVKVPPGVESGNRLRYRNEGEAGRKGGPNGDLFIVLRVEDPDVFQRDGADLHLPLPIHYAQAVLGAKIEIPTLEGTKEVVVKPGTQHGDTLKLRGMGLPRVNRSQHSGDLIVHFQIEVPQKTNKRERELLEELAALGDAETRPGFFERLKDMFAKHDDEDE